VLIIKILQNFNSI